MDELEKLRASSESSAGVDSEVDNKINQDKRLKLIQSLQLLTTKLLRALALGTITLEKPLVRSHLSSFPPHNLTQDVEFSSVRLTTPIFLDGEKGLGVVDNRFDRTLTFDEFSLRFNILFESISKGSFDDFLEVNAEILVHAIMGQSGELLSRLGIDPKAGETYKMLEKEVHPVKVEVVKVDWEKPIKAIAEFAARAIQNSGKPRDEELPEAKPIPGGLGMVIFPVDDQNIADSGLRKGEKGLLVIEVFENSQAQKAGVRSGTIKANFGNRDGYLGGDIIIGIEDSPIVDYTELKQYLDKYHVEGSRIKFNILRDGKRVNVFIPY